jgi:hypothetical protein
MEDAPVMKAIDDALAVRIGTAIKLMHPFQVSRQFGARIPQKGNLSKLSSEG